MIAKSSKKKAQRNLDKQAANASASSSENVGKCEFLTGKDVLPEKKTFWKKLLQLKHLNICYKVVSWFDIKNDEIENEKLTLKKHKE